MSTNPLLITILTLLSLSGASYGQAKKSAVNFLGIEGPLSVQKKVYQLAWSAHPDASLYKQEYIAAGDRFPNFNSLVMVDFVLTASTVDQVVSTKIHQLETLKATNPSVNFNLLSNAATGEKMIDCLIGQTAADDQNSLVERTVYRFKSVKTKAGQSGVLLFAVSTRSYGKDVTPFLVRLKADKPLLVNEVAKLAMPTIRLTE
ncbi:hypothetical protein GCM10028818_39800 [Spirosoma horti]